MSTGSMYHSDRIVQMRKRLRIFSALGKSRNQFIVDAVINQIRNQDHAPPFSLSDIRKVVREEFQATAVSPHTTATDKAKPDSDMSELDPKAVLDSLSMFD